MLGALSMSVDTELLERLMVTVEMSWWADTTSRRVGTDRGIVRASMAFNISKECSARLRIVSVSPEAPDDRDDSLVVSAVDSIAVQKLYIKRSMNILRKI